jgi:hypothetical protein
LHDLIRTSFKKDAVIAVNLRGVTYEKGRAYILFLKPPTNEKPNEAASQMKTKDGKQVRARVQKLLAC